MKTFLRKRFSKLMFSKFTWEVKRILCAGDESKALDTRTLLADVLKEALTNVPFYRDNLPINPREVSAADSLEILQRFPFITKSEIMVNQEAFANTRYRKSNLIYTTSGGSTGQGIGLFRTRREIAIERFFFDHFWGRLGFEPGVSRVMRIAGEGIPKGGDNPWRISSNRLLISPYHLNAEWLDSILAVVKAFEPEFIHSYPSLLYELARHQVDSKLKLNTLKGIFLASEHLIKSQYELFQEYYQVPIIAHYGMVEHTNLALHIGFKNSDPLYKLVPEYGYSENLVNNHGQSEIVGTSYWLKAMPMIRYRTQDFGTIKADIIEGLEGRAQEFLVAKDGQRIPGTGVMIEKKTWNHVDKMQVYQKKPGEVTFLLKLRKGADTDIGKRIIANQELKWGHLFKMNIEIVADIPKTSRGKTPLVRVERS